MSDQCLVRPVLSRSPDHPNAHLLPAFDLIAEFYIFIAGSRVLIVPEEVASSQTSTKQTPPNLRR